MLKSGSALVYLYAKKHWPSGLPKHLMATKKEVRKASEKAVRDLMKSATCGGVLVRLAGQSGSGKTTQLLPAALHFFEKQNLRPAVIAARNLAKYHPHYEEILAEFGEAEIRKRTDDFATILMYLVVVELTRKKCDMIIDLSFASTKVENLLILMTKKYTQRMVLLMAVAPKKVEELLRGRSWRHTQELEREFLDATEKALKFYGKKCGNMRAVMWGFDKLEPIYDGEMMGACEVWEREMKRKKYDEKYSIEELVVAKKRYLAENML